MDDLPDPPAMRGRFVMDRDGDVWQLIYGQTFLWRCLTTESTDQMGGDLLNVCGPLIDLVPATEIESLRARLAQAEAERDTARAGWNDAANVNGWIKIAKGANRAACAAMDRAERAEAALARVTKLCDAAIDRRKRLSSADGYNEISLRGAADLATNVLAALVVADTQPSLETKCCDLHGRNCEPPSELCCDQCTEAHHGIHGDPPNFDTLSSHHDGSTCSNPDLSGFGLADTPTAKAHQAVGSWCDTCKTTHPRGTVRKCGWCDEFATSWALNANGDQWPSCGAHGTAACQHGQAAEGCRLCAGIRERQPADTPEQEQQ